MNLILTNPIATNRKKLINLLLLYENAIPSSVNNPIKPVSISSVFSKISKALFFSSYNTQK
jgi:hypothetical protein